MSRCVGAVIGPLQVILFFVAARQGRAIVSGIRFWTPLKGFIENVSDEIGVER